MLALILNIIVLILCIIYLVKKHTWYQSTLLGVLMIATGIAEEFTSWQLDFWSYFVGAVALMVLNLTVEVKYEEDKDE